ncbi:hypothetical protein J5N97_025212 [Dioscorea zingiberensis]|uniref:C3H1-type domain-containing protein n=1 Tax=Dioscorea zingiberensis TaxID=325984 RepID=A0A9D5H9P1_9LILI|nr:hypothetical protein J5N97_025212 [Dioscorea zingiberensis]
MSMKLNKENMRLPMYFHRMKGNSNMNMVTSGHELDDFLMYTYKVQRCPKTRSHDWTECPFAHRGEKAKRRDPRKFPYTGIACPDFRQGGECPRANNCEYSHGVFEFWLHPSRYRTRLCEAGLVCPRKVCFFAHSQEQLRPEVFHDCFRCGFPSHPNNAFRGFHPAGEGLAPPPPNVPSFPSSSSSSRVGAINPVQNHDLVPDINNASNEEQIELPDIEWVLDLADIR